MAKLSANGQEVVRYRTASYDEIFGRDVIREYSLRDNGWVLVKVQHGDKSWTPWKRWARVGAAEAGKPGTSERLERLLAKRGSVEKRA